MSLENKIVVRRFFEQVINSGTLDRAQTCITDDYAFHQQLPGAEGRHGVAVATVFLTMMWRAFPDDHFEIQDLIAEGDKVVACVTVTGTHEGEMMGMAPTGRRLRTSAGWCNGVDLRLQAFENTPRAR